jgi:hypothetical protein
VNIETISSIARCRRAELNAVAAQRRAVRACAPHKPRVAGRVRIGFARIALALGDACYLVGDALIPKAE